ncbi:MAG: hypothetical protein QOE34_1147 [Verrucomicrobiota bacterium]|jgi:hypothetical protein
MASEFSTTSLTAPEVSDRALNSVVFAPRWVGGGVKSLYTVCEWLDELGHCTIVPFGNSPAPADWFAHRCRMFDFSYHPDLIVYPEVFQPEFQSEAFKICFALGQHQKVKPFCDLVVCKSPAIADWLKEDGLKVRQEIVRPSIARGIFEYDGRPKKDIIAYMTRIHKHPEMALSLRTRYGDQLVEIVDRDEAGVAEILKDAKVFIWRGDDKEGSPRPPKEALVAGCVVVGLREDLNESYCTDFGIQCATLDELMDKAGEALSMDIPGEKERAYVRDSQDERADWHALVGQLPLRRKQPRA